MWEIRIHGRGGQGVVTLAELFARTAIKVGLQAQTLPFFGVERRGATVKAVVRLDEELIKKRSQSYEPDFLILMNRNLMQIGLAEGIKRDGIIIANSDLPLDVNYKQWIVNATGIAIDNNQVSGGQPFVNVPILGAICRVLNIPFKALEEVLAEQWSDEKLAPNIKSAQDAYENVKEIELQGGCADE